MVFEEQYMTELENLFNSGEHELNQRTGVEVKRIPHVRFQVNLEKDGLPILRSKKLFAKSATDEILWIMQRQSNKIVDINSGIWNQWVDNEGTIGKAYGYQVNPFEPMDRMLYIKSKRVEHDDVIVPTEHITKQVEEFKKALERGDYGTKGQSSYEVAERCMCIWLGMMQECYFTFNSSKFVDKSWRDIFTFVNQFKYIEGYKKLEKLSVPCESWCLSTSYYDTNCYSLNTVVVAPASICQHWDNDLKKHKTSEDEIIEFTRQTLEINQVSQVIRGIITDPSSRRLMINLWNIYDLPYMGLEPCCFNSDFTVINGVLHCAVTQRSGDSLVGVPFNMYQYSVLTYALATVLGLRAGLVTLDIADFHVYMNQFKNGKLQLKRWKILQHYKPLLEDAKSEGYVTALENCTKELKQTGADVTESEVEHIYKCKPHLVLPKNKNFYDLTLKDFRLHDYMSLPEIKYEVAK